MAVTLKREDLEALLTGFAILGTGGGGDPDWGREIILKDWQQGREYEIVSPNEVEDDALICSAGIMGSVKQFEELSYSEVVEAWEKDFLIEKAVRLMEQHLNSKIDYIMPFEVGGLNTAVIMTMAARLGIPVIDADFLGRAAPETQMTTCIGLGVDLYPMPVVDSLGNQIIVQKGMTSTYADEIGRIVASMGGNYAANAHYPMKGKDLKRVCVPGTISNSINIGRVILDAEKEGLDIIKAFTDYTDGFPIFRGKVSSLKGEEKVGFYVTTCNLLGVADFEGSKAELIIKNESMALWVDGKLKSVFPDLACMLYSENGRGILSNCIEEGTDMTIIGIKCHDNLRKCMETDAGKYALGGARYGCPDLKYIPIEKING